MDVSKLSAGLKVPEDVFVVVEIPANSSVKYEIEKESGALFVDRFLFTAMYYPFNYGFIPKTLADDGDAVDVLVIGNQAVFPGSVMRTRPIGMLVMEDEAGMAYSFKMLYSDFVPKNKDTYGIFVIDEFSRGDHTLQQLLWLWP